MDGFKAYRYYLAIKLHFTTDKFNVFDNRGSVRGTREAFNARNDRYIFEKLSQKISDDRQIIQFFVSNFAYGNGNAIYEGKQAEDNFQQWMKTKQSISQVFIDDLASLITYIETNKINQNALFNFTLEEYPILLKLFISGKISIETMRIIDDLDDIISRWGDHQSIKYIWEDEFRRIKKLTGFVKYDRIKLDKVYNSFKQELQL